MLWILGGLSIVVLFTYCLLKTASNADAAEEKWWKERKKDFEKGVKPSRLAEVSYQGKQVPLFKISPAMYSKLVHFCSRHPANSKEFFYRKLFYKFRSFIRGYQV